MYIEKHYPTFERLRPAACFSKVLKLFGPISDASIPFISSRNVLKTERVQRSAFQNNDSNINLMKVSFLIAGQTCPTIRGDKSNWITTNQIKCWFLVRGEKNLLKQSREPTNSIHIWQRVRKSNPYHIGRRRVLSPLRQPCSLNNRIAVWQLPFWGAKCFRDFRETGPRGLFLESPENHSGPKSHS